MGKRNRSSKKPVQPTNSDAHTNSTSSIIQIILAIIGALGAVIAAYLLATKPVTLAAEYTQTAEAHLTAIVMTTQVFLGQITDTPTPFLTPLSAPTETEIPTETSTPTPSETPSVTPTEIKPIRYEYTVQVGDTLKEISKKFFVVDFYADAIGKANCNQSPSAGDILIIKYYYIQQGDTIDLIANRFGNQIGFLRFINNLSQQVISLPPSQILILAGKCGS